MNINEILKITDGKLVSGDGALEIETSEISTDSRSIRKGQFFIALKGPNFDGNIFALDTFKKGAVGAIVSDASSFLGLKSAASGKKVLITVKDTLKAFQDLAAFHRRKIGVPVIAITGSNGKTTVKEMLGSVLSTKYNVLKNTGTENNHIGVPATLLRLKRGHQLCVLEVGANHKGEIGHLGRIAGPDAAVITNVGPSHLEFFGDMDGVYKTKTEIMGSLDKDKGVLVINGDDKYLSRIKRERPRIVKYGFRKSNDYSLEAGRTGRASVTFVINKRKVFGLNLCGMHNVYNAAAAIVMGDIFGIDYKPMREALYNYRPAMMRMDIKEVRGISIINDSYNSNPLSMSAALEALKSYPAKSRWVVSADMLELGAHAVRFHASIGDEIARSNVDGLLTLGALSGHTLSRATKLGMKKDRLWHCKDHGDIVRILKDVVRRGDAVLLKGSRAMRMEKVLEEFANSKI